MRHLFRNLKRAIALFAMMQSLALAQNEFNNTGSAKSKKMSREKKTVTVIGIDAGDWQVINYLRKRGELPNFDRLIKTGTSGPLESIHPMFTPIVWTTISTGKPPILHGIRGFKMLNPDTGRKVPVNRTMRRVKALWNITSDYGKSNLIVGHYATWPAEKVKGIMVSDYTLPLKNSMKTEDFLKKQGLDIKYQTYPRRVYGKINSLFMDKNAPNQFFTKRFKLDMPKAPYALRHSYAKDLTYFKIYRNLRKKKRFDYSFFYIQGPDLLSHSFYEDYAKFIGGKVDANSASGKKAGFILEYYKMVDEIIGIYDKQIRLPGENLVIVSDHGFEDKHEAVLTKVSDDKFAKKQYWHRKEGILIANGPNVKEGARIKSATIFDITPTVLAMLDIPIAKDLSGRPIKELLHDKNLSAIKKIATYEKSNKGQSKTAQKIMESPYDEAIIKSLNDLGYIQ